MKTIQQQVEELLNLYLASNSTIDITRGQCLQESFEFAVYLEELGLIPGEDFDIVWGHFEIDNPENLPLTFQDLYTEEYNEFLDLYEDDIDTGDPDDISYWIWQYIQRYKPGRISKFYLIPHAWVEVYGVIVDVTKEQFSNSVDGAITDDRYIKD